jgi:hypothetical protein
MEYLSSKKLKARCPYEPDYHFDSEIMDTKWDTVVELGKFDFTITPEEIQELINTSVTVATKLGQYGRIEGIDVTKNYASADPEIVLFNANRTLPPTLQKITDLFALDFVESRVQVQLPGQMWNLHIDKLQKWNQAHPQGVMRIVVHLTAWEPGHFWNYGNYMHAHWQVGDVHTFDWMQVPHSTANAGLVPRLTLQITGEITENTERFLENLKTTLPYVV